MKRKKWKTIKLCIECETELSDYIINNNNGICPNCLRVSNSTTIDHKSYLKRFVSTRKWWQFWSKKGFYEHTPDIKY